MPSTSNIEQKEVLFQIAHLSDIHFGRISHPAIVEALVDEVNGSNTNLVVVSGDLTQRARRGQFKAAAEMLASFKSPVLVVPGNHDVYPWWRPISRLVRPLTRFQRYIEPDLYPSFANDDVAVLGINSAIGYTVKGGHVTGAQRSAIRDYFTSVAAGSFKVLVVHHHLTQIAALGPHDVARSARMAMEAASNAGVDLVLCGHLHISHIHPFKVVPAEKQVVIASAGTATSNRGRQSNRGNNFYNRISIGRDEFSIEERYFDTDACQFRQKGNSRFERTTSQSQSQRAS